MEDDKDDKKLYIDEVIGGEIGQLLIDCYFKLKPDGKYTFHEQNHAIKGHDIQVGSEFTFRLDQDPLILWHLTVTSNDGKVLKGNWWDGKDASAADGEYQAQAGGTGEEGEEDESNAASAGGYVA